MKQDINIFFVLKKINKKGKVIMVWIQRLSTG